MGTTMKIQRLHPLPYVPGDYTGDLYDIDLSIREIADILCDFAKQRCPRLRITAQTGRRSIDLNIKGKDLYDDDRELSKEGADLEKELWAISRRYDFDHTGNQQDYWHGNFHFSIFLENTFDKKAVAAEAERLREVYTITDKATLQETRWSIDPTEFQEAALALLKKELDPKIVKKPVSNPEVTAEMDRWIVKVAAWCNSHVMYDTGPRYYRVYRINVHEGYTCQDTLCFVDRQTGTVHKASYKTAVKTSTRGTIFEGINVFNSRGLIAKSTYDRLHEPIDLSEVM